MPRALWWSLGVVLFLMSEVHLQARLITMAPSASIQALSRARRAYPLISHGGIFDPGEVAGPMLTNLGP